MDTRLYLFSASQKWLLKAVRDLADVVLALHSQHAIPNKPLASTTWTPVRIAAAVVIDSFHFYANF